MVIDLFSLEARYLDICKKHGVLPNSGVLLGFFKAKLQKSRHEICRLEVFLDQLKDADFPPLINMFSTIDSSEIDAVDILHETNGVLNGEHVLSMMRAINNKLQVVDLQDFSFGKDFLRDLSQRGLACQVLNLRSSHIRKLNMVGKFMQLHTLNLDFSTSLISFKENCFSCMPNLMRLSMCETRVSNLWTTSAALSKLPSLVELRFQNGLCCNDTGPYPASSNVKENILAFEKSDYYEGASPVNGGNLTFQNSTEETLPNLYSSKDISVTSDALSTTEESSDDSEVDFSNHQQGLGFVAELSSVLPLSSEQTNLENEVSFAAMWIEDEQSFTGLLNCTSNAAAADLALKKYISHHPSPICFEKHYREYIIASLPRLQVLDNLPVKNTEREMAKATFSQHYEYLPYNRRHKNSVVSILQNREMGVSSSHLGISPKLKQSYISKKNPYYFSRSICAAKIGSSAWPSLHPVSKSSSILKEGKKSFRPRQFEYHPSNSSLMAFGTLDGELVVINHEIGKVVGFVPSMGALNSILGLCWLKKYPSKLITGSDSGSLQLYDVRQMPSTLTEKYCSSGIVTFDGFEQLTSVHVNSADELFLASGYSKNVALYDIGSGKRLQVFNDMHREHINVVKFSHYSPSIFATSSFDRDVKMWDLRQKPLRPCYTASSSRGNVMVCFSPDDHYLLASAVDNEVNQFLAVDGRLHMKIEIASTGSAQNYTRSYYMNGRDYIISGSCDEYVVRICCAQTGRRLKDISLEGKGSGNSMFVQSLRGDPFREFNMSILAAYTRPSSKSEIIKVDMMASSNYAKEYSYIRDSCPSFSMGG